MSSGVESERAGSRGQRAGKAMSMSGAPIIKTILLAALSSCLSAGALGSSSSAANRSGGSPIWQRPGCHQVGHTRTISIPGCVKFNLSTNACRGYCMSFSIPAAEDIGPASGSSELDAEGLRETVDQLASEFVGTERAMKRDEIARRKRRAANSNSMLWTDGHPLAPLPSYRKKADSLAAMVGGSQSPLAGAVGNTGEKRDVISVGQCCNMMETEDVTVNLRCGFNETRRLVFKSAKTCECFFCKQV